MIVGLGNPGKKYTNTRHNAGFLAIDRLANDLNATFKKSGALSRIAHAFINGFPVILLKPQTFMNNSGLAVAQSLNYYKIDLSNLLIVVDDINLPLGKIRLRAQGSAGGHNGLKSIIQHLKTQDFARLRLGIGRENERVDMVDFVLSTFSKSEMAIVEQMLDEAVQAIKSFVLDGIDITMTRFNA